MMALKVAVLSAEIPTQNCIVARLLQDFGERDIQCEQWLSSDAAISFNPCRQPYGARGTVLTVDLPKPTAASRKFLLGKHPWVRWFDYLQDKLQDGTYDAAIWLPQDWRELRLMHQSRLQLARKPVAILLPSVSEKVQPGDAFHKAVLSLERYRNLQVIVTQAQGIWNGLYDCQCFHDLREAAKADAACIPTDGAQTGPLPKNLADSVAAILQTPKNNKRQYIGWRYHANELRQKIKFNKDLFWHEIFGGKLPFGDCEYVDKPIPRVIHYCWFGGGKKPALLERCMATWPQILKGYQFKIWTEQNFPADKYVFAQQAFAQRRWAMVSDVARLHALYYEGGIYLDTDMEVLKSFDDLLDHDGFMCYHTDNVLSMGAVGFKAGHPWVRRMLTWYTNTPCDVDYIEIANAKVMSKITRLHYGIKLRGQEQTTRDGVHIYPADYFMPPMVDHVWMPTERSYTIHHFSGLW